MQSHAPRHGAAARWGIAPYRNGTRAGRAAMGAGHGGVTAAVPWARHGSRFTTDFAFFTAWMVKGGLSKKKAEELKNSKYALGKNERNLTERQRERLSMIQSEDGPMARGHRLKERLKSVFALEDPDLAEEYLDKWIRSAQHCRIVAFVELQRKIRRHREHILNTIRFGLSNARIEATNNKIKLMLRIAYGFRNIDTMISLVMLFCSSIEIPWYGRKRNTPTNTGV